VISQTATATELIAGTNGSVDYGSAEMHTLITVKVFPDAGIKSTYGTVTGINIGCILKIIPIPLSS